MGIIKCNFRDHLGFIQVRPEPDGQEYKQQMLGFTSSKKHHLNVLRREAKQNNVYQAFMRKRWKVATRNSTDMAFSKVSRQQTISVHNISEVHMFGVPLE